MPPLQPVEVQVKHLKAMADEMRSKVLLCLEEMCPDGADERRAGLDPKGSAPAPDAPGTATVRWRRSPPPFFLPLVRARGSSKSSVLLWPLLAVLLLTETAASPNDKGKEFSAVSESPRAAPAAVTCAVSGSRWEGWVREGKEDQAGGQRGCTCDCRRLI